MVHSPISVMSIFLYHTVRNFNVRTVGIFSETLREKEKNAGNQMFLTLNPFPNDKF